MGSMRAVIRRASWIVPILMLVAACSDGPTPTSPTPPTTTPPSTPPAPTLATVHGVITDAHTSAPVVGASVTIRGGNYDGRRTTTDGNGYFSLPQVSGTFRLIGQRDGYNEGSRDVTMGPGDTRADFQMVPFWRHAGQGNTVFDMPPYVTRVQIVGEWLRRDTSNFIVRLNGRTIVNEILRESITYSGVHLVSGGGVVEIVSSSNIRWSFQQVQ